MPSEELEYRAKLVELIYSTERNLLTQFAQEADGADASNGHASASNKIIEGFARELNRSRAELEALPNEDIRAVASALFTQSSKRAQKFLFAWLSIKGQMPLDRGLHAALAQKRNFQRGRRAGSHLPATAQRPSPASGTERSDRESGGQACGQRSV